MNSTTHGCYATNIHPITHGPFAEDAEAISAFVEALIVDLAPRDALEGAAARHVAELLVKIERASTFESEALASASSTDPDFPPASDDEAFHRGQGAIAAISEVYPQTTRIDSHLSRQLDAALARYEKLQQRTLPPVDDPEDSPTAKRTQSDEQQPSPDDEEV